MTAKTPRERLDLFFDAVNGKDMEAAIACYEKTAVLHQAPVAGDASGLGQIREAMAGFLTFKMELIEAREVRDGSGELAITGLTWRATGTGPDGKPVVIGGRSTEVQRRQANGDWLFAIDCPWWAADKPPA